MNDKKIGIGIGETVATAQEFVKDWRRGEAGELADETHTIEGAIERFDPIHKAERRTERLPLECRSAFALGQRPAGAETVAA